MSPSSQSFSAEPRVVSHSSRAKALREKGPRDQRLDFWRGLCLIDMVLVHLYYQNVQFGNFLGRLFGDYTRFAAGGFIFVSGLSIGVIFWPRSCDPVKRPKTYKALWRRSLYILGVNYLCAMLLVLLRIFIKIVIGQHWDYAEPFQILRDIFLLRDGGDLLPFYVMMIAISPLVMMALRSHKWGWLAVLVSSLSLFTWGLWHPWAFAPAMHQTFPPVLWQAIFILGLLLGYGWKKYNAIPVKWKLAMAAGAWGVVAALFVNEYGYQWGMGYLSFGTAYTKVPLSTPEALRYLAIIIALMTTTDSFWPWIKESNAAAFVQTLGRKSLPVYAFHLLVVEALGALASELPSMGSWQILFAVFAVLLLWLWALVLDVSAEPKQQRHVAAIPALFGPEAMPGAAQ